MEEKKRDICRKKVRKRECWGGGRESRVRRRKMIGMRSVGKLAWSGQTEEGGKEENAGPPSGRKTCSE